MISLLVVNYRSAPLAAQAIATARAATRERMQVVVVDNSVDPREADALRAHADVLIASATNRGYAGGINDGRRACDGERIVISNPDVAFAPHSIDKLLEADAAAAGPALFWDDAHRWLLPPAELHAARQRLDAILAGRSRAWQRARDRRRTLQRIRFWRLTQTTEVRALSGAVLAIRSDAPPFDERFALYFEETDFLRSLRGRIVYVPQARVRHLYNQSAGQQSDESALRYAQSELRYLEKWNGPWLARLLKKLERPLAPPRAKSGSGEGAPVLTEASPLPTFETAAGSFDDTDLPSEVLATYRGNEIHLRTVNAATGEILQTWTRKIRP
jgi:N-acetylglucosaminyl-diphospho-decaprenol L-rhamnosyltransferase